MICELIVLVSMQEISLFFVSLQSQFGELSEWLKEPASKTGVRNPYRGFESLTHRKAE